jgi:ankyrin repeat protein
MNSFVKKFDKPHIPIPNYDIGRKSDMISAVLSLDTHEILQCNLMYKIPFTISDDDDNSLIHLVLTNPNKSSELAKLSVIKFLVNNGVNPDKPNKYNVTPLHIACRQQLDKIVKYLLENYTDPNFKDNMGLTAFHYLLSGNIIPIQSTEPTDFIPLITNVNQERQDALNKLKDELNDPIQEVLKTIPLYKTLENTIKQFIETDEEINKQKNTLILLTTSNPINTISELTQFKNNLINIISNKFVFNPIQPNLLYKQTPRTINKSISRPKS